MDVKKIFERLREIVVREGEEQVQRLPKPENLNDSQWGDEQTRIRRVAFRVTVTISGAAGDSLFGDSIEMFDSPNLPHQVAHVYMTNRTAFRGEAGRDPIKSFELNLDFSKPPLIDGRQVVSAPTENHSKLNIHGDNDAWVATVNEAVFGVLKNLGTRRGFIHRGFVYDIGLMVLAMPAGFYLSSRTSEFLLQHSPNLDIFVRSAIYVYELFLVIWIYRILFGYTKWIFPSVELKESSSSTLLHRAIWSAIALGIAGNFCYDLVKLVAQIYRS